MKYMTFRGSHVYTCIAILLEDFKINKFDKDIALEMRMPYLFMRQEMSKTKIAYTAGTRLQSKIWFDLFLNHYDLEFIEEHITKLQTLTMLQNLSKFKRKALLSLHMDDKQYAVVFSHHDLMTDTYIFIMPEQIESPNYRYIELHEENLLNYLADHVHIGFINPTKDKTYTIVDAIKDSLKALDDYLNYVTEWCDTKRTKHRQIEGYDMVFRALIVDVRRMMKLKGEDKLHDQLNRLSHAYVKYLRSREERFVIPLKNEFREAILSYRAFIEDYLKHIEHSLKY